MAQTEQMPAEISDVVDAELEVLRDHLVAIVRRTRRTPIIATAALLAVADVAAYVLAQAEDLQNLLRGRPQARMKPETAFSDRFRSGLMQQRGHRKAR